MHSAQCLVPCACTVLDTLWQVHSSQCMVHSSWCMVQSAQSKVSEAQKKRLEERWEAIWGSLAVPGGGGGERQMRPTVESGFFYFQISFMRYCLCAIVSPLTSITDFCCCLLIIASRCISLRCLLIISSATAIGTADPTFYCNTSELHYVHRILLVSVPFL